jgi:hypothetical protein
MKELLKELSEILLDQVDDSQADLIDEQMFLDRWLGYPPASETAIAEAEARLGVKLPPSYREFLSITNGWRSCCDFPIGICDLDPVEKLRRFVDADRRIGALEGYLRSFGSRPMAERPKDFRAPEEELRPSLAIGVGDGNEYLLLTPAVIDTRGEWKVWSYHNECGFSSSASFGEFLETGLHWR